LKDNTKRAAVRFIGIWQTEDAQWIGEIVAWRAEPSRLPDQCPAPIILPAELINVPRNVFQTLLKYPIAAFSTS
jgi:hypothetical protein